MKGYGGELKFKTINRTLMHCMTNLQNTVLQKSELFFNACHNYFRNPLNNCFIRKLTKVNLCNIYVIEIVKMQGFVYKNVVLKTIYKLGKK